MTTLKKDMINETFNLAGFLTDTEQPSGIQKIVQKQNILAYVAGMQTQMQTLSSELGQLRDLLEKKL